MYVGNINFGLNTNCVWGCQKLNIQNGVLKLGQCRQPF